MKRILKKCDCFLTESRRALLDDIGLLALRVATGGLMMVSHGWDKLSNFGDKVAAGFPDPFGIGVTASLGLATFAEFFCSLLVIVGLATRLAATQLIATMAVAAFIAHSGDIFGGAGELAAVYLGASVAVFLCGPGRFSLDRLVWRKPASGS